MGQISVTILAVAESNLTGNQYFKANRSAALALWRGLLAA
jgi:hypothetical protein